MSINMSKNTINRNDKLQENQTGIQYQKNLIVFPLLMRTSFMGEYGRRVTNFLLEHAENFKFYSFIVIWRTLLILFQFLHYKSIMDPKNSEVSDHWGGLRCPSISNNHQALTARSVRVEKKRTFKKIRPNIVKVNKSHIFGNNCLI